MKQSGWPSSPTRRLFHFDLQVNGDVIEIRPFKPKARAGWAQSSQRLAQAGDDALVWPEVGVAGDAALTW